MSNVPVDSFLDGFESELLGITKAASGEDSTDSAPKVSPYLEDYGGSKPTSSRVDIPDIYGVPGRKNTRLRKHPINKDIISEILENRRQELSGKKGQESINKLKKGAYHAALASPFASLPKGVIDWLDKTPEGVDPLELTGIDKLKALHGGKYHEALIKKINETADQAEKVKLFQELGRAEEKAHNLQKITALTGHLATKIPGKVIPYALASAGIGAFGRSRANTQKQALRDKYLKSFEKDNLSEEDQDKLLASRSNIAARLHVDSDLTDKVTAGDVTKALLGGGALAGATAGSAKGTLEKLLGAQRFWHGTTSESGKNILETGLDPGYGGRVGGAAWRETARHNFANDLEKLMNSDVIGDYHGESAKYKQLTEKKMDLLSRLPSLGLSADQEGKLIGHLDPTTSDLGYLDGLAEVVKKVRPGVRSDAATQAALRKGSAGAILNYFVNMPSMLANNHQKMDDAVGRAFDADKMREAMAFLDDTPLANIDASNFQRDAEGRAYVGISKSGPKAYARMQDPEAYARMADKALKPAENASLLDRLKAGLNYFTGSTDEPTLIGGVMPHDKFRATFESDKDDTRQLGTAWRTNDANRVIPYPEGRPTAHHTPTGVIGPENLAKEDVSLAQILKNRATNMGDYIRGSYLPAEERMLGLNKRFLSGLGRVGALAGTGAAAYQFGAKPMIDKLRGKHVVAPIADTSAMAAEQLRKYQEEEAARKAAQPQPA